MKPPRLDYRSPDTQHTRDPRDDSPSPYEPTLRVGCLSYIGFALCTLGLILCITAAASGDAKSARGRKYLGGATAIAAGIALITHRATLGRRSN